MEKVEVVVCGKGVINHRSRRMLVLVRKKKLVYWTCEEPKRRNPVTDRYEEDVVEVGSYSLRVDASKSCYHRVSET